MYRYLGRLVVPVVSLDAPPAHAPSFFPFWRWTRTFLHPRTSTMPSSFSFTSPRQTSRLFPCLEARVPSTLSTPTPPPQSPASQTPRPAPEHIPGRLTLAPALAVRSAFLVPGGACKSTCTHHNLQLRPSQPTRDTPSQIARDNNATPAYEIPRDLGSAPLPMLVLP